ncbi:hypothetical protein TFKS16_2647 [Tannerella forsythia KS16]|uniref:Uncharacterized protein n=1 Tax=Tannerella forsythia (strain ATCC 43037 / JCM 10827 / CCUG 21028 A / KCTC 5666 / FDC 338) TaxID=203275 RepID=G8UP93_TANFA|nr:hypothetical protein BFO_2924 [Tannerella forsythia 92A2]BAR50000.1 hypothetical protein TF3313_2569 [Tannerella forsythia 3313]BAR52829.1 hypothetical protein TFKS16_2647 [Tannerella forsythia KS16]
MTPCGRFLFTAQKSVGLRNRKNRTHYNNKRQCPFYYQM